MNITLNPGTHRISSIQNAHFAAARKKGRIAAPLPNGNQEDFMDLVSSSEQVEKRESPKKQPETTTNIVVKPDGSRVLVVTVNIGGMNTTMSLQISEPTEMPNDSSEQNMEMGSKSGQSCQPA